MGKIIYTLVICLIGLFLNSCTSYIRLIDVKRVPNENAMQSRVFDLSTDTLEMQFFSDYRFDKLLKEFIVVSNSDLKKINSKYIQLNNAKQFLFTYTDLPDLNNVVGLYYENQTIEEVQKLYLATPIMNDYNGLMYVFDYKGYFIADVFKSVEGGVIRFLNVSKFISEGHEKSFIEHEIKEMYFVRN